MARVQIVLKNGGSYDNVTEINNRIMDEVDCKTLTDFIFRQPTADNPNYNRFIYIKSKDVREAVIRTECISSINIFDA